MRALRATPQAKTTAATCLTIAGFTGLWPFGCKGESLALRASSERAVEHEGRR
jgi:hypothetical protein